MLQAKETIVARVKQLLEEKKIQAFLGLKKDEHGKVVPYWFQDPSELDEMSLGDLHRAGDVRYPLNLILRRFMRSHPFGTFAVLVRGCDERGVLRLFEANQLDPKRVVMIGIACPSELAEACRCDKPYPDVVSAEEVIDSGDHSDDPLKELSMSERMAYWKSEFNRCIKCYGCREICPMCFCYECTLDSDEHLSTGDIPPENPSWHMTRAIHMVDLCIECGLCEEVCPADIPLRTLYREIKETLGSSIPKRAAV